MMKKCTNEKCLINIEHNEGAISAHRINELDLNVVYYCGNYYPAFERRKEKKLFSITDVPEDWEYEN